MTSYSQAGQDKFAYLASNRRRDGIFLDVGAHDGYQNSNTLGLEAIGWDGLLVDIQCLPGLARRRCDFVCCDTLTADWPRLLEPWLPHEYIDYLSLDVDDASTQTLEMILKCPVTFGAITIEHDLYRVGPVPQMAQRNLLLRSGYDLVCSDVMIAPGPGIPGDGGSFEDWYLHKAIIPRDRRDRYRCHNQLGTTIIKDDECADSQSAGA